MGRDADWSLVARWNEALRRVFFDGQAAGHPVYLDLEHEILRKAAEIAGVQTDSPAEALRNALLPTLHPRADGIGLFAEHILELSKWQRAGRTGTPPFLAVLALLSLVAEHMRSDEDFSASNYYGRLCVALGVDPRDDASRQKVQRGLADESHRLWGALNDWLLAHDGALGLPTAYAFDYRVHVGVPMSQALVRASDRVQLLRMFADFRLAPGQALARSDMARLLKAWLPDAPVSRSLARLADDDDTLDRIADVACVELEAWDGTLPEREVQVDHAAKLLVAATLRQHPRPRLELYPVARGLGNDMETTLELQADASSHARAALPGGALHVTAPDADGWSAVLNGDELSMPDLLLAKLRARQGDLQIKRDPRRLVVLEHDEELHRYVEVPRVQLGQDTALLCHQSLLDKLELTLQEVARRGYRVHRASELPGVPEDWMFVANVEVLALATTKLIDLAPLVPMSWTQISFGGGFPLPGRATWLRSAPPELRVSSFVEGKVVASLLAGAGAVGGARLSEFEGATVINLEELRLPDGDYQVVLSEGSLEEGTALSTRSFKLRSANTPRELAATAELASRLGDGWGALSASEPSDARQARGGTVAGESLDTAQLAEALPPAVLVLGPVDDQADEEHAATSPAPRAHGGDAPLCLLGGPHYIVLEDAVRKPRWKAEIEGICKYCGLEKHFPARPRSRRNQFRSRRRGSRVGGAPTVAPAPLVGIAPIRSERPANFDALLEALCYARSGSWDVFSTLAQRVHDEPWFALEAARLLQALGHLELALDRRTLRPTRWAMAPSCLAVLPRGGAVLCGARSDELVAALRTAVGSAGGDVNAEPARDAPTRVEVAELSHDGFDQVVATMAEAGFAIELDTPAPALAEALPSLAAVMAALPRLERLPDAKVERFDFERNRWLPAGPDESTPGAYRVFQRPLSYAFLPATGDAYVVADNRVAKWLGAAANGLGLMAYDADAWVVRCPLGAQLPGLFERALVLCSGRAPVPLQDGTVAYEGVPPTIAAAVWEASRPATSVGIAT